MRCRYDVGVRWRHHRRPLDARTLFYASLIFFLCLVGFSIERWLATIPLETIVRTSILVAVGIAVVAMIGWVGVRVRRDREHEEEAAVAAGPGPMADAVAVLVAVDADAAPVISRDLTLALKRPGHARLRAVAQRLLDAQLDYRLVGLRTAPPRDVVEAARGFDAWGDDVRTRFARKDDRDRAAKDALVVLCLLVETDEEIVDLPTDRAASVTRTLELLANDRWSVRRVELFTARQPIPTSELRAIDPTLITPRG